MFVFATRLTTTRKIKCSFGRVFAQIQAGYHVSTGKLLMIWNQRCSRMTVVRKLDDDSDCDQKVRKMGYFSQEELSRAKNALQSSIYMNLENRSVLAEDIGPPEQTFSADSS